MCSGATGRDWSSEGRCGSEDGDGPNESHGRQPETADADKSRSTADRYEVAAFASWVNGIDTHPLSVQHGREYSAFGLKSSSCEDVLRVAVGIPGVHVLVPGIWPRDIHGVSPMWYYRGMGEAL